MRLPGEWALELVEIKAQQREQNRTAAQTLALEATRIRAAWVPRCYKIALDERGTALTTIEFARMLATARERTGRVAFVIGSADGLDATIKREADLLLCLSAFTLPHGLVRVILAEQLYRAVSVLQGHPYHRE